MFGKVVLNVESELFEDAIDAAKRKQGVTLDYELSAASLMRLVEDFKQLAQQHSGVAFPQDPYEQLRLAIAGGLRLVEQSASGALPQPQPDPARPGHGRQRAGHGVRQPRAGQRHRRCLHAQPEHRRNRTVSASSLSTPRAKTSSPGVRTPQPISEMADVPALAAAYAQLTDIARRLETHYTDMQDMEFTVQNGQLFMLQTRTGKRTGQAGRHHRRRHGLRKAHRRGDCCHAGRAGAARPAATPDDRP